MGTDDMLKGRLDDFEERLKRIEANQELVIQQVRELGQQVGLALEQQRKQIGGA
jgi:hypothetical protein